MQRSDVFLPWLQGMVLAILVLAGLPAAAATSGARLSLSPSTTEAGGADFTLTIHGAGLSAASVAEWNGNALATESSDATTLTAEVPASLIASAGTASVTVVTGVGVSAEATFTINPPVDAAAANPAPVPAAGDASLPAQLALPANLPVPPVAVSVVAPSSSAASSTGLVPVAAVAPARTVPTVEAAAPAVLPVQTSTATVADAPAVPAMAPRSTTGTISVPAPTIMGVASVPSSSSSASSSSQISSYVGAAWYSSAATLDLPPTVSSIMPNAVVANAPAFTVTVNGTNFLSGALATVVRWGSTPLTTTYISSTQVTAAVPASLVVTTGTANVSVVTTGGTSSSVVFTIQPPVPAISSLSPSYLPAGYGSFLLYIYGSQFPTTATLNWGSTPLPVISMGSHLFAANIPASLLATTGAVPVTITTAGGTSAPITFTVQKPIPTLSSLVPMSAPAGSATFTLTINGANFVSGGSLAMLGGVRLATTYVSTTQLTAVVPASLLTSASSAGIVVYTSGGGWSPAIYFTVTSAPPTITSLSQTSVVAGYIGFSLTVNGAVYTLDSTIMWGSTPLDTVYVSPTELVASVPSSVLGSAGPVNVTVSNSVGVSLASVFTIQPAPPSIESFTPAMATAGMAAHTITVTGGNFTTSTKAVWGTTTLTTTYVSTTELTAVVPASLVTSAGSASLKVTASTGTSASYTIPIHAPIQITPTTLPAATVGSGYTATINVTGGSPGYNWTVTGLPDSMTYATTYDSKLTLTGTLATAGTISFQVAATDQAGAVAGPIPYTVNVGAGPTGANNASLDGSYVCLFQGTYDMDGTRWAAIASFQADGQGNFTGGVFDTNSYDIGTGSGILSGTYNLGADNNGIASIHTVLTENIAGIQTMQWSIALSGSAQPAQQFRMIESDDQGTSPSGQQGSANCYLATASAFASSTVSGQSLVFGMDGENNLGVPREVVGRFSAAAGTAAGVIDSANGGSATVQSSAFSAAYTTPDPATGRFTMQLSGAGTSTGYTVYIIDANRMFVLDNTDNAGELAGNMRTQQQTSYSAASLNGPFVLYDNGTEFTGSGSMPSGYYANIEVGAGDGAGNLTVARNYGDDDGAYTAGNLDGSSSAVSFDAANPGRATFATANGTAYLYLFNAGNGFVMDVAANGSIDSGWMEPQTQTTFTDAALAGNYLYAEQASWNPAAERSVGVLGVTSTGTIAGNISTAGVKSFSWNQQSATTYAWDAAAPGSGTFQIANGAQGAASCAVISTTRFVCTAQTDPSPTIEIAQQ